MEAEDKARVNRVRRMAERQGFALRKSRRRDPHAPDYGAMWLVRKKVWRGKQWGAGGRPRPER